MLAMVSNRCCHLMSCNSGVRYVVTSPCKINTFTKEERLSRVLCFSTNLYVITLHSQNGVPAVQDALEYRRDAGSYFNSVWGEPNFPQQSEITIPNHKYQKATFKKILFHDLGSVSYPGKGH